MTDQPDLAAVAATLAGHVERLSDNVEVLAASQRRVRRVVVGVVLALVLNVVLSVVVAFVAVEANRASSLGERNREAARVTCESGNEARRVSRELWTYVLNLAGAGPDTPRQRQQIAQFRRYIATVYADRDCNADTPTVEASTPTPTR